MRWRLVWGRYEAVRVALVIDYLGRLSGKVWSPPLEDIFKPARDWTRGGQWKPEVGSVNCWLRKPHVC